MDKKQRICKICNRRFANGKAMGGHMRSHLAKLPVPPKLSSFPSSSSASLAPPSPSAFSCRSELSSESTTVRRSKRFRKFGLNMVGSGSGSPSDSDEILSTDAAMSLLMLSRDNWTPKQERKKQKVIDYEYLDDDNGGVDDMDWEGDENYDDELFCVTNLDAKYKCETCKKVFKSHQALGGHRANHKNKQIIRASTMEVKGVEAKGEENGTGNNQIHQQRMFECPFCDKVFQSGQALGGHKKVHLSYLPVADNRISNTPSSIVRLFDLNLPAAEDDDEEVSLIENSMASTDGRKVNSSRKF